MLGCQTPLDQADTPSGPSRQPPGPSRHPPRPGRPPWDQADPPRDQADPPGQGRHPPHPPDQADTPPGPGRHPRDQAETPTSLGSRLEHTVYERPVHILLECILVKFLSTFKVKRTIVVINHHYHVRTYTSINHFLFSFLNVLVRNWRHEWKVLPTFDSFNVSTADGDC